VFTLVALVIIDKAGRRRIACWTIPGMAASLILASVAFHFLTLHTNGTLPENGEGLDQTYAPVVLAAMILYVACYATGIGNIPVRLAV
jgi:SP family myo-inositol transporter-like MFS transporter 13